MNRQYLIDYWAKYLVNLYEQLEDAERGIEQAYELNNYSMRQTAENVKKRSIKKIEVVQATLKVLEEK